MTHLSAPSFRLAFVLPLGLLVASCGAGNAPFDVCSVATDRAPAAGAIDATDSALTCDTTSGTPCDGTLTVTHTACSDGFGFVLDKGGTQVGLRFKSDGGAWTFGASLGGTTALTGTPTIQGMVPPGEPVPPAGKVQKVNFALSGPNATYTGTAVVTW